MKTGNRRRSFLFKLHCGLALKERSQRFLSHCSIFLLLFWAAGAPAADNSTLFAGEQGAILPLAAHNGVIYWAGLSCGFELVPPTPFVRSQPAAGGATTTLFGPATCNNNGVQGGLAVDDQYVYWANVLNQVVRQPLTAQAADVPTVVATSQTFPKGGIEIAVDAQNLYWLEFNQTQTAGRLVSQPKAAGAPVVWSIAPTTGLQHLRVDASGALYYLAGGTIVRLVRSGVSFVESTFGSQVQTFALDQSNLYWIESQTGSPDLLLKTVALSNLGQPIVLFTIPGASSASAAEMWADGLFVYWIQTHPGFSQELLRYPLATGTGPVTVSSNGPDAALYGMVTASDAIFYVNGVEVRKLPQASPGLDIIANEQTPEVVQVIQGPQNDVPLVQGKDTFVRVYARLDPNTTNDTSLFLSPAATLSGTRNGQTLAGSPLSPLTDMTLTPMPLDRRMSTNSVVFELPSDWTNGTITVQATINPAHSVSEGNYTNNTASSTVTFNTVPTHCLQIVPVSTALGVFTAPSSTLTSLMSRAESVYPLVNFSVGFIGGPAQLRPNIPFGITGSGPYTLNSDVEMGYLLWNMWWAYMFNTGYACDGGGTTVAAPVLDAGDGSDPTRVGMSTPGVLFFDTRTGGDAANTPIDGIDGLAHEIGHELGRSHIDCPTSGPNQPGSTGFYPYPTCQLDVDTPSAHVGFDSISHTLLPPATTADMMTYFGGELWISDYHYKANLNQLRGDGGFTPLEKKHSAPSGGTASDTKPLSQIGGIIGGGRPLMGFAFPIDANDQSEVTARLSAKTLPSADYQLRTYDKNNHLLASEPLRLVPVETEGGPPMSFFFQSVSGVPERYEVTANDGSVVLQRSAGFHPPTLKIKSPRAGESYTDAIDVEWDASDPDGDPLLFALRYSADNGASWRMLGGFTSEHHLPLDLSMLPGGSATLLEVMASDGVHTATAMVGPFNVATHAPRVQIADRPGHEVTQTAPLAIRQSESAKLLGDAYDVEDGKLKGQALNWKVTGLLLPMLTGNKLELKFLTPGTYPVELTATDSEKKTSTAKGAISVAPKMIARGVVTPRLDGRCTETLYARDNDPITFRSLTDKAAHLRAALVGKSLYVCLTGIPVNSPMAIAGVRFAPERERHGLEATDRSFALTRLGVLRTASVSPMRHWQQDSQPKNAQGAVFRSDLSWNAEFRIDAEVLGKDPLLRMQVFAEDHGTELVWPRGSKSEDAASWGLTTTDRLPQSINFAAIPNEFVDDKPISLQVTASSGLRVTYTVGGMCTLSGSIVSFTGAGACSVTATQAGNEIYSAARSVTQSFAICKKEERHHEKCCLEK